MPEHFIIILWAQEKYKEGIKVYNQVILRKGRISIIYSDYNSTRRCLYGFIALSLLDQLKYRVYNGSGLNY